MNSSSIISQQLLEQNEDIIAAVVENLQLGRLDDCIKHYSILQSNLIAFALELDNFPGNTDAYEALPGFPDEIMRKDILEDLQPHGTRTLPEPPLIPPCVYCIETGQYSSEVCRLQLHHVDPSSKFSFMEREEFLQATQVIASRNRLGGMDANSKSKRLYKIWNSNEKYSMLLAVAEYGNKNIPQIASIMETRSENQIRSYIQKHLRDESQIPRKQDILRKVPKGYQPPPGLAHLFGPGSGGDASGSGSNGGGEGCGSYSTPQPHLQMSQQHTPRALPHSSSSSSSLAPQQGRNDWSSLLSMAAGVIVPSVHVTSSGQIHHTFPSNVFPTSAIASSSSSAGNVPSSGQRSFGGSGISGSSGTIRGELKLPPPVAVLQLPSLSANIPTASLPPPPLEAPTTLADPLKEIVAETKRLEEESRNRTYYATQLALNSNGGSSSGGGGAVELLGGRVNSGADLMGTTGLRADSSMPPPVQKRRIEPPPFARPGIAKLKMQRQQQQQQQHQQFQSNLVFGGMELYGSQGMMMPQQQPLSQAVMSVQYHQNRGLGSPTFYGEGVNPSISLNHPSSHTSVVPVSGLEPHDVGAVGTKKNGTKTGAASKATTTAKRPYKGRKGAAGAEGGVTGAGSEAANGDKTQSTSDAHSARYNFDLSDLCSSPNREVVLSTKGKVRKYNAVDTTTAQSSASGAASSAAAAVSGGGVSLFSAATNLTSNKKRPPLPPTASASSSSSAANAAHAYVPVDPELSLHGQDSCLLLEIDDNCSLFN